MSKDNANPTALSLADLPSRHSAKTVRKGPDTRYDDVIFSKPAHLTRTLSGDPLTDAADPAWFALSAAAASADDDDLSEDIIDEQEIYDLLATISDPEHPLTLGQLSVVNLSDIQITPSATSRRANPSQISQVLVKITPTIVQCSMATIIGLAVRARLEQALPPNYRVDVMAKENTHNQDEQLNKQLADKERVAAALENQDLKNILDKMLTTCV